MENLPLEMQLKIFSSLKWKSLLSMASTNRSWRDLILNSHDLMRCINFKLTNFDIQQMFLEKYGCGVSSITIGEDFNAGCRTLSIKLTVGSLKQILRSIPNIREIKFNSFGVPCVNEVIPNLPLPRLQKLTLINNANNHRIFYYLDGCSTLKEYTTCIERSTKLINYFSDPVFWNWLNKQHQLETLKVSGHSVCELFKDMNPSQLKINLKKLTFDPAKFMGCRKGTIHFGGILEFLKLQDGIEEISLKEFSQFNDSLVHTIDDFVNILDQIFFKMPNLKVLNTSRRNFYNTMNFTNTNTCIEKLIVKSSYQGNAGKCFDMFPNVKNLKWIASKFSASYSEDMKVLRLASSKMLELEKFKLSYFKLFDTLHLVKFSKLRKISLYKCTLKSNDWKMLVQNMPLIQKLVLDAFSLTNDSAVNFKNWTQLMQIVFKCGIYQLGLINILSGCQRLKHLKISATMNQQFDEELKYVDLKIEVLKKSFNLEKIQDYHSWAWENKNIGYNSIHNKQDFIT